MAKQKRDRNNLIALTGAAALVAIAVNFAISAINNKHRKKKGYFTLLARLFKQIWEPLVIIWEIKNVLFIELQMFQVQKFEWTYLLLKL